MSNKKKFAALALLLIAISLLFYYIYTNRNSVEKTTEINTDSPIYTATRFFSAYQESFEITSTELVTKEFITEQKKLRNDRELDADPIICAQDSVEPVVFSIVDMTATSSELRGEWKNTYVGGTEYGTISVTLVKQNNVWLINHIGCAIQD